MERLVHQIMFNLRVRYPNRTASALRKLVYRLAGMQIGRGTILGRIFVNWPHQVLIGSDCLLQRDVVLQFAGIWAPGRRIKIGDRVFIGRGAEVNITHGLVIGNDSLIAAGCRLIDHDHGTIAGELIRTQECPGEHIAIGNDVWLGSNVVLLKGVSVGDGAVVAAGAVVTRPVPPMEIWGGVPARKLGERRTICA